MSFKSVKNEKYKSLNFLKYLALDHKIKKIY